MWYPFKQPHYSSDGLFKKPSPSKHVLYMGESVHFFDEGAEQVKTNEGQPKTFYKFIPKHFKVKPPSS